MYKASGLVWVVLYLGFFGCASRASDSPDGKEKSVPSPAQSDTESGAIAKAFADAQAELRHREEKVGALRDWQGLAIDARELAGQLARKQGKAIAPYLRQHAGESPLLALLTLDALGMYDEAAQVVIQLLSQEQHLALLEASLCSAKAREAIANLLVQRLPKLFEGCGVRVMFMSFASPFLAVTGTASTVDVLKKTGAEQPQGSGWKEEYDRVTSKIQSRLSLPKEHQPQRAQDELLFWQTAMAAPCIIRVGAGQYFAAKCLVAHKLAISSTYLIEQLEQAKEYSPENYYRILVTLPIIAYQKENGAVPAMVALAQRRPSVQERVEVVLRQIDTPETRKALLLLAPPDKPVAPEKPSGGVAPPEKPVEPGTRP